VTGQFPQARGRTRTTPGAGELRRVALPPVVAERSPEARAYMTASGCSVLVAQEPALRAPPGIWLPQGALELWHLSVARPDRLPSWDEVADVRYELVPDDVTMALLLPPPDSYMNEHEFCLHLWQIEDRRSEAES
jgi:hypothetical protein